MLKDKLHEDLEKITVDDELFARTRYAVAKQRTEEPNMATKKPGKLAKVLVPSLAAAVCIFIFSVGACIVWPLIQRNQPISYDASGKMAFADTTTSQKETQAQMDEEPTSSAAGVRPSQTQTQSSAQTSKPSLPAEESTAAPSATTAATQPSQSSGVDFTKDGVLVYDSYKDVIGVLENCYENLNFFYDNEANSGAVGAPDEVAPTTGAMSEDQAGAASGSDYSQTNIQVAGVDEADVVKTDGSFVYYIANSTLYIVDVRDPKNMETVASISGIQDQSAGRYYSELYYDEQSEIVTLIGSVYTYYYGDVASSGNIADTAPAYVPYEYVFVESYDVSDPAKPELIRTFSQEGYYVASRRIDSTVYLVTSKSLYTYGSVSEDMIPWTTDNGGSWAKVPASDIYISNSITADCFTIVSSIDTKDDKADISTTAVLGAGNVVYSTPETLYVAGSIWDTSIYKTYDDFYADSQKSNPKASADDDVYKTRILAFSIENGALEPKAIGLINGSVLNQYSMDEYNGALRVATTSGGWTSETSNNIVALDEDLTIISALTHLAPGESIYSARFNGDRIYLVTFEQVDPFFVIDASDPQNLSVIGELKIPGYSNYLHMINNDLVLAIGNETYMQGGSVRMAGLKIAVFDVSDPESPKEVSKLIYGKSYGYSEVQYNPKALLLDLDKGFIGLPLSFDMAAGDFGNEYIDGYVLIGISKDGTLSHMNLFKSYDANISSGVNRGIYIGNTLYLLGYGEIASFDMTAYKCLDTLRLLPAEDLNPEVETYSSSFAGTDFPA